MFMAWLLTIKNSFIYSLFYVEWDALSVAICFQKTFCLPDMRFYHTIFILLGNLLQFTYLGLILYLS